MMMMLRMSRVIVVIVQDDLLGDRAKGKGEMVDDAHQQGKRRVSVKLGGAGNDESHSYFASAGHRMVTSVCQVEEVK
jgi:glycerate kinase